MVSDTKDLQSMTTEELKELKREWYRQAKEDGSLVRCYKVCTVLGERLNAKYGPKYRFLDDENELDLYVDDYGNYFTAEWRGKRVMSTHPCDHLFIPGDWMKIVDRLYPFAAERAREEEERREDRRRQQMAAELSI